MRDMQTILPESGLLFIDLVSGNWQASKATMQYLGLKHDTEITQTVDSLYALIADPDLARIRSVLSRIETDGLWEIDEHFAIQIPSQCHPVTTRLKGYLRICADKKQHEFTGSLDLRPLIANAGSLLAQIENLLSFSDEMMALLDLNFSYVTANEHYCTIFGRSREALIGKTIEELFAHDPMHYQEVVLPSLQQAARGEVACLDRWLSVPGFGEMYMKVTYFPYRNHADQVIAIAVVGSNRTEVMRSIEELRHKQTILNRTEQIANLGGWSFDPAKGITEWTDEMYKIHEVDNAEEFELTPENLDRLIPENDRSNVHRYLELGLLGQSFDRVAPMITVQGNHKWIRSVAFPVTENDKVVRIDGIIQDITEFTNIQKRLEQSEEKYRSLVEETNALLWEADITSGQISYMSSQAAIVTGYPAEYWKQTDFRFRHLHDSDRLLVQSVLGSMQEEGRDQVLEYRLIKPDNSIAWFQDDVKIVRNNDEQAVSLRGVMVDITGLKQMQEGLNRALHSLESQKAVLDKHAIVDTTDRNGVITSINNKFLEISGYQEHELLGRRHSVVKSGLHSAKFFQNLWDTVNDGQVWQGEICNQAKNGKLFWVYTTIVPLKDESGHVEEFIAVRTDTTGLKKTEESLRRVQKMEAIGQLTGGIAHDFNNLLGIVIGNLELAEMGVPGDEQLHVQIENAKNAALRGSVLTRRLLNFSHQSPVYGKALDLNLVLSGLKELISKSLTAQIRVDLNLCDDIWLVEVDQGDFEDAVINLSINAGDAMPNGGQLLFSTCNKTLRQSQYINSVLLPAGEYVEIIIADTGFGMSREVMDKIFEPYFSTKPSDKGSGLGLAMVYGFVKRSKGMIFVDSTPEKGAKFSIYIPRSSHLTVSLEDKNFTTKSAVVKSGYSETILLVDDEVEIAKISTRALEKQGYKVICCFNANEAMVVLKSEQHIDLLFTDVVMPGKLNGFELADLAESLRPDLKVLFTTGYAKVQKEVKRDNLSEVLISKPYRSLELSVKIRTILEEH